MPEPRRLLTILRTSYFAERTIVTLHTIVLCTAIGWSGAGAAIVHAQAGSLSDRVSRLETQSDVLTPQRTEQITTINASLSKEIDARVTGEQLIKSRLDRIEAERDLNRSYFLALIVPMVLLLLGSILQLYLATRTRER